MKLSVVIPVYNEEKNLEILHKKIVEVMSACGYKYEIIFADDGSTDRSYEILEELRKKDKNVKIVSFYKNFGQTAAMDAGIKLAKGEIIVTLDSDLQNDPRDIPRLVEKIKEGYDVVSGWRWKRKDPFFKKIVSRLANLIRRSLIKERIHDSGCTLKAFRRDCFDDVDLYGEMHRYIPSFLRTKGCRIAELKVRHNPRLYGKTKYGSKRIVKGFLDLIMIHFWTNFASRPMHFFGTVGLVNFILGFLAGIYLLILKFVYGQGLAERPLLLLVVLLIILGVQFIIFGIIAEILMRIYYKTHHQTYYKIKRKRE